MVLNKSNFHIRKEKYPCPDTVDGICSMVREILSGGMVQKLELDLDGPIRVQRAVEVEDPDLVEPHMDWDGALRNVDMIEYYSEGASAYQVVIDVMQVMQKERLNATCWVGGAGGEELLDRWFEFRERGMPTGAELILGRPVHRLKSLPEETLILCGSKYPDADPDEISLAIKFAMELRRSHEHPSGKTDDRERTDTGEHFASACELALVGSKLSNFSR